MQNDDETYNLQKVIAAMQYLGVATCNCRGGAVVLDMGYHWFLSLDEILGVCADLTIGFDIVQMGVDGQGLERVVGHLGGESEQCGRISLGDLTTFSDK